jgi:hypothetical protein
LSFNNLNNNGGTVSITADQNNMITESNKANNTAQISITNTNTNTNSQSSNNTNSQNSNTTSTNTLPDLKVTVTGTNLVSKTDGSITATTTFTSNSKAQITFTVENTGGTASGQWKFNAQLPSSNSNSTNYTSDLQNSLEPGQKALLSITFDGLTGTVHSTSTATITVNPNNQINEVGTLNNSATAAFPITQ